MNIYEYLHKDHKKVENLFNKMEKEKNQKKQDDLFGKLKNELLLHAHSEHSIFYAELNKHPECTTEIVQAEKDHQQIENTLKTMASLSPWATLWLPTLVTLKETVLHHVNIEENNIFKLAKDIITSEMSDMLIKNIKHYKDQMAEGKMQLM
jgi:hemerythrin superfamily protein